ncbi:MAG: cation:proton antiporter [Bacteroidales bacterium]|nr:cation:proton antiporter [Bacteroidales bacterium]
MDMLCLVLPVHEPLMVFLVLVTIIFLSPYFFRMIRVPEVASFIVMGVLVGPNGFNILPRDSSIELLGTVGLLYIMFMAGLELDAEKLKISRKSSLIFGMLTFIIPFILGWFVSKNLLGMENEGALLIAIMFSTHTLVAYPIARRLGINRDLSVLTAVGGTIITDILVLMILSMATQDPGKDTSGFGFIKLLLLFAGYTFTVFYTYPRIAGWFFRHIKRDRTVHYLFLLFMVCLSAFAAELIGTEAIIGAFLAGLALNKKIPRNSLLMHHVDFVGNILFIPVFLIGTGMLINTRILVAGTDIWYLTLILILAAFTGKWLAALITRKLLRMSALQGRILFGMSASHAAATLAVIIIGLEKKLIDIQVFNAAILIILVSSLAASMITERAGKKLALTIIHSKESFPGWRILVPIANPLNMSNLVSLAHCFQQTNQSEPVYLLNILNEKTSTREHIINTHRTIENNVSDFNNLHENLKVLTRVDLNISSGIIRVAREYMITDIVLGIGDVRNASERIFGSVLDNLMKSEQNLFGLKVTTPLNQLRFMRIFVPPLLMKDPLFPGILGKIAKLSASLNFRVIFSCLPGNDLPALKSMFSGSFKNAEMEEVGDFYSGKEKGLLTVIFMFRKESAVYDATVNTRAKVFLGDLKQGNTLTIVPGLPGIL